MDPFRRLIGIAAPLPVANIDTDLILSAAFLKTVSRAGLGRGLFHAWRFDADGAERADFILNREPWRRAAILIALDNFGCGSSREHAPWALLDFGVRCIIAPSFADIFYGNCFKNGILPIRLARAAIDLLMRDAHEPATAVLAIDLEAQTIIRRDGRVGFDIDAQRRDRLLNGVDDISDALRFADAIARHEETVRARQPWLADARLARLDAR
jgi:3-isopropylmalate/(R)-2-methylmalate dehydratase small subunit